MTTNSTTNMTKFVEDKIFRKSGAFTTLKLSSFTEEGLVNLREVFEVMFDDITDFAEVLEDDDLINILNEILYREYESRAELRDKMYERTPESNENQGE